jgi:CRP/FNR family transcriptional regulator, cyclic AMP receptor protein
MEVPVPQTSMSQRLGRVDLFSGLSRRDLDRLARSGRTVDHDADKEIVTEGRDGLSFHLVLGGSADVEVGGQHRRRLGTDDYFGEISLLDGKPRTATVRAGSDGLQTFAITSWDFHSLLRERPEVAHELLITLCARLRDAEASADQ